MNDLQRLFWNVCNRCNHKWVPRSENIPKVCPKCKSPYWNKKRVRKLGVQ